MDVLIVLGSKNDLEKARDCTTILNEFGVVHKLIIASAHRSPEFLEENIREAHKVGVKIIIAMAGMSAHLPGVIASKTIVPVIGVPISSKNLAGIDALLSILQMPAGYPVATVSIDGAKNSALLAVQMLAVNNEELKKKLFIYRDNIKQEIINLNKNL